MRVIIKLLGLQELELEINALEAGLVDARDSIGESSLLRQARNDCENKERIYIELVDKQKMLDWQSEETKNKIKKTTEQLYSGRITNPKELTNLQLEVELLSANLSKTEEELIAVMVEAESAQSEAEKAKTQFSQVDSLWKEEQKDLLEKIESDQLKLASLKKDRESILSEIDSTTMNIYQAIKKQRGTAVARIVQGACGGCRISLSSAQLQRSRGTSLERCSNCGRILFGD